MKVCLLILTLLCCISFPCLSQEVLTAPKSTTSILPIFSQRHSGRSYDSSRSITQEQILLLAKAARSAPSSYNEQPWVFIFCDRTTDPDAYAKAMKGLVEFNQGWAKNAPLLVVISADTKSRHTNQDNKWSLYDTGAAAVCMALQATAMGLMAHQMGGFDADVIRKEFNIPAQYVPMSIMAIGYESSIEAAKIPSKERLPLKENFFMGSLSKSLEND